MPSTETAAPVASSSSPPPPIVAELETATAGPTAIFLSLSPQSLASLAAALPASSPNAEPDVLLRSLASFLPSIGIGHVSDTTFARHLALSETVSEFTSRRASSSRGTAAAAQAVSGPILASACPGWVCYAEKAHGEVLPHLSRARSPLGIQGALVKGFWARRRALRPDEVYHVAIQPCPDRKLESSRTGFRVTSASSADDEAEREAQRVPETDLVLSTDEFAQLLERAGFDPTLPPLLTTSDEGEAFDLEGFPQDVRHPGSSSDGYLHAVLGHVAGSYDPSGSNGLVLAETPIRGSADYVEYVLSVGPRPSPPAAGEEADDTGLPPVGTVLLRAAACYGFKNLQNVVRKTKLAAKASSSKAASSAAAARAAGGSRPGAAGAGAYDYVEVMACPSGCVNGGGQLKPASATATTMTDGSPTIDAETRWSTKAHVALVEGVYQHEPRRPSPSSSSSSSALTAAAPPPKPIKARPLADSPLATERQLDPRVRHRADALERVVRAEMDGFCRAHPEFYARSSSSTTTFPAAAAVGEEAEEQVNEQAAAAWRRTTFERIDPAESDGGLLGSGVVW